MSTLTKSLGIGDMFISDEPCIVSTILGSCVSVVIYSKISGVGGIIHYALPDRTHASNSTRNDLNFGDSAVLKLYQSMLARPGVDKKHLEAKILGGGSVINELVRASGIGELNVTAARKTLEKLNVRVTGEHVGGDFGRKIYFYTDSGRVRVSRIETQHKSSKKIGIMIVDDSKTIRDLLSKIFICDEIEVMATAASAEEADKLLKTMKPDVITLDIHMPGMDGVTFLQKYLPQYPIPTVMISSISMQESNLILKALEIGAVDYIQKPTLQELSSQALMMREKIITASKIKVHKKEAFISAPLTTKLLSCRMDKIVAIGASTGGTEAIKDVLTALPANIPPIVIVQHIPPVFSSAFAKRLNDLCPFEVKEGVDGDKLLPGRVIIAPGGMQMELVKSGSGYAIRVFDGERVNRHKPSVDVLFNSVAKEVGANAVGVILTGMGEDGAAGLLKMKNAGAYTIAQDEASSVVYGMPRAAALMGGVLHTCHLKMVSSAIVRTLEKGKAA